MFLDPRVTLVAEQVDAQSASVDGRLVVVVDSREGVAAALPERLDEVAAQPWDRIVEAAFAAAAVRAGRSGGAASALVGASTRPDSSAPAGSDRVPEATEETAPPAVSLLDRDDEQTTSPGVGVPSRSSHRPWRRRKGADRRPKSEPESGPARVDGDPPPDDPPALPTVNFWD